MSKTWQHIVTLVAYSSVCRYASLHGLAMTCISLCSTCIYDLQINNAGCMVNTRELTEEGLEKNFATNTLGNEFKIQQKIN